jgi:poly-gamma-glutamate capsule biosynthesis protein CapA/YwtB (metallophosphatase superfamily)
MFLEMIRLSKLLTILLTILLSFTLSACQLVQINHADQNQKQKPTPTPPSKVTIAAIGDVIVHESQLQAGKRGNHYDFNGFFQAVKPYLSATDLTVANLETTLAGPSKPYSGYPNFNTPDEILDAVQYSGIDILTTANNHAYDTGEKGVIRTHLTIKKKGFLTTGTAPSHGERKGVLVEKNGIKIGFLAYTEQVNGTPSLDNKSYLINRINPKLITKDIQELKQQGAESVVVSLHWGTEYQLIPNDFQKETALKVFQAGADVILGSHPHVLQPIEKMIVNGKEKLIIYSMGNFISNQSDPHTDEGVIIYFDVKRNQKNGQISVSSTSFLPTVVNKYKKDGILQYLIVPLPTKEPANLSNFPRLTRKKWESAWSNTEAMMTKNDAFPVFSLNQ